jgi:hypothetical protein
MQFLPESWTTFGVDADGDGIKNPDDPWDAIFAAARLLRYWGAPSDLTRRDLQLQPCRLVPIRKCATAGRGHIA